MLSGGLARRIIGWLVSFGYGRLRRPVPAAHPGRSQQGGEPRRPHPDTRSLRVALLPGRTPAGSDMTD